MIFIYFLFYFLILFLSCIKCDNEWGTLWATILELNFEVKAVISYNFKRSRQQMALGGTRGASCLELTGRLTRVKRFKDASETKVRSLSRQVSCPPTPSSDGILTPLTWWSDYTHLVWHLCSSTTSSTTNWPPRVRWCPLRSSVPPPRAETSSWQPSGKALSTWSGRKWLGPPA